MSYLRDALIACGFSGFMWYVLKLQPLIALVIMLTVFFSLRSINKRYPDKKAQATTPPAKGNRGNQKKNRRRK